MAIYFLRVSNISRNQGSSSLASLSYIIGKKINDTRLDKTYKYSRAERVVHYNTIVPPQAKSEWRNAENLFNAIELHEKGSVARTAVKIVVALPKEFNKQEQITVLENYIKSNITSHNYACTYAIHYDKDNKNPHAHILIANRQINSKGEWGIKRKMEYVLDGDGNRIPQIDKTTGEQKKDKQGRKQWKRISVETNPLDTSETLKQLREGWAKECNKLLDPNNQIDHRSYEEQGIDKQAELHEGYVATKQKRLGQNPLVCQINEEIREQNRLTQIIHQAEKKIYEILSQGVQKNEQSEPRAKSDRTNSKLLQGELGIKECLAGIERRKRTVDDIMRKRKEERERAEEEQRRKQELMAQMFRIRRQVEDNRRKSERVKAKPQTVNKDKGRGGAKGTDFSIGL